MNVQTGVASQENPIESEAEASQKTGTDDAPVSRDRTDHHIRGFDTNVKTMTGDTDAGNEIVWPTNLVRFPTKDPVAVEPKPKAKAQKPPKTKIQGEKAKVKATPKAFKNKKPDLSFIPAIPKPYFFQATSAGASLMKDERGSTGKRPYLMHFPLAALQFVFKGVPLESHGLSPNKLQKAGEAAAALRNYLSQIEREAARKEDV